jgi:hypothetical protein
MLDDFLTEGRASASPILAKQDIQKHVPADDDPDEWPYQGELNILQW